MDTDKQRFRGKRHNFVRKKLTRLHCTNDDKIIQSIDSVETYLYGMSK